MPDLSDFFKLVSEDKKKKKEEFNSIVGDLELNSLFGEFAALKKETKKKKIKEQKTVKAFEKWLYSETPKKQKEIIEEVIEESLDEVLEILEDHKEELKEFKEPTLIEKSLGLLSEPSNIKVQNDPLTPLDQKFATLDDLQKHYKLFLNRIQQQLSTLGGGGETRLEFLDDVDRDSAKVNNKFLKYNSNTGKWEGSNAGGGGPAYYATTYITSSSYTITENDYYIGVNYAGAVTITLPIVSVEGTTYIVKDELGEASKGTNRYITILPSGSDLIDGRDRAILAYDYGSLTFVYRNGWRVV
ncbi:MAG: hypothetical protein EB127_11560 [Alphaproteobacteria bacterium]|nr:hypothetical protein [Alphaproteobacteria bacterium]